MIENNPSQHPENPKKSKLQANRPMTQKEWLLGAVKMLFLVTVVLPLWTAFGLILIGPVLLLKKYSSSFSPTQQTYIDKLYGFSKEIFCMIGSGIKYASAYFKQYEIQGEGEPILLVHGYLHNASGWSYYLKRFQQERLGPVYTINLGHPFLPLKSYAKKVEQKALEIQKQTGRKDLTLIGHSMGGIVSALYATQMAPLGKVTDLFTIGSPLKGTPLANWLGIGPNAREMQPDSLLLREIRKGIEEKKEQIRFYHIGSDADQIVPAESALLDSGDQFCVTHAGHLHLMTSKKVVDWICHKLNQNRSSSGADSDQSS